MRVLLVDDDAGVRALARVYAEQAGCVNVVEVSDGVGAVEAVAAQDFDAVVVDFHMPGMDGLETVRQMLAARPLLDVIAWTSVLDRDIERAFLAEGARSHVPKTETETLRLELAKLCAPPVENAA